MGIKKTLATLALSGIASLGAVKESEAKTILSLNEPVEFYNKSRERLSPKTFYLYEGDQVKANLHAFNNGGIGDVISIKGMVSLNFVSEASLVRKEDNGLEADYFLNVEVGSPKDAYYWTSYRGISARVIEEPFDSYNLLYLGFFDFNHQIPEPSTAGLFGAGLAGLAALRKRK